MSLHKNINILRACDLMDDDFQKFTVKQHDYYVQKYQIVLRLNVDLSEFWICKEESVSAGVGGFDLKSLST